VLVCSEQSSKDEEVRQIQIRVYTRTAASGTEPPEDNQKKNKRTLEERSKKKNKELCVNFPSEGKKERMRKTENSWPCQ